MAGLIYSAGVKKGYVIAPWWFLAGVAIIAAVPIWWLVEGEGFGGDGDVSDDEEDEDTEVEDNLQVSGLQGEAQAMGKPGPTTLPTGNEEEHEERAYGGLAPLSRTNTQSSVFSTEEAGPASRTLSRTASGTAIDRTDQQIPNLSRRGSKKVLRKMSIPIGMGSQGISRRYSSNLGQSFGSAGSFQ
jgi:hypothetical protein